MTWLKRSLRTHWKVYLLVLVALGGCVWVAFWAYGKTLGIWDDLDAVAGRIRTPVGMTQVLQKQDGTVFCVISCNEAKVVLVYETDVAPEAACVRARLAIARAQIATSDREKEVGLCPFSADLPEIYHDAGIQVSWFVREDFARRQFLPQWYDELPRPDTGSLYLQILLTSGID